MFGTVYEPTKARDFRWDVGWWRSEDSVWCEKSKVLQIPMQGRAASANPWALQPAPDSSQ